MIDDQTPYDSCCNRLYAPMHPHFGGTGGWVGFEIARGLGGWVGGWVGGWAEGWVGGRMGIRGEYSFSSLVK